MAKERAAQAKDEDVDLGWERAVSIEMIVRNLTARFHPHLTDATIRAYFRPKARQVYGKTVMADIRLPSPLIKAITADLEFPVDYVITVGKDRWETLPQNRQEPYIDHELCHAAGRDAETDRWTLKTHDVEEFQAIVERWGTRWRVDLEGFARACTQMPLNLPGYEGKA